MCAQAWLCCAHELPRLCNFRLRHCGAAVIPGPVSAEDRQLAALRGQYPHRRIQRTGWGWLSYVSGAPADDDVQAPDLDLLGKRLADREPPAGRPSLRDRTLQEGMNHVER